MGVSNTAACRQPLEPVQTDQAHDSSSTMAPNILPNTALPVPALLAGAVLVVFVVISAARYISVLRTKRTSTPPPPPHILQFPPSRRHTLASFAHTEKLLLSRNEVSPQTL